MKYFVELAGREHAVTVDRTPDGAMAVTVNGKPVPVALHEFTARELLVRVGDRVADVTVEGAPPTLGLVASGQRTYVKVESERDRLGAQAAGKGGSRERDVRSPMPGRVVKVLVELGATVAAGSPVAIVEAMKMENEVRAKGGGVVVRIHVAAGATVEANAKLVSFEA